MPNLPARKRLRAHLDSKRGRTQAWLAEKLGVSQQTVSSLLRDGLPGIRLALRVERVFGIPPREWLNTREGAALDAVEPATLEMREAA